MLRVMVRFAAVCMAALAAAGCRYGDVASRPSSYADVPVAWAPQEYQKFVSPPVWAEQMGRYVWDMGVLGWRVDAVEPVPDRPGRYIITFVRPVGR
jgi:hypothetical protein